MKVNTIPVYLIQVILLILWYALPQLAAVPWWIIWFPVLATAACFGIVIGIPVIAAILLFFCLGCVGIVEAIVNWNSARIRNRRSKLYR